ncbi:MULTISPECIES: hypothetical protein [unclassified Flavobacterium]|uniref:hypothetical protein n=1 Tax=unclassified Flavobacterium TaxID=196869 RepID=UPI00095E9B24|nr:MULTISPECIES: hypothetical protein [unclassified Flavobacterium]MBN9284002.1 hypothetical protein [Flavobacterium sp.]OJV73345.1 MAG: hypothetical protein BGO42_09260 [Flavobacterium sp. 40-81]
MQKIIFYVVALLCLVVTKIQAQETFEQRAKVIAENIENITREEKKILKDKVDVINTQLENKSITREEADKMKMEAATFHAKRIEERVAFEESRLNTLIKEKVDGKIQEASADSVTSKRVSIIEVRYRKGNGNGKRKEVIEKRTTSQLVLAGGVNNLVTGGAVANSKFRYWGSHFYEFGLTFNTRIMKNNNLLHAKYGMSLVYNNLRAVDNQYFVKNNDQTELVTSSTWLSESRLRNIQLIFPAHLEFDFTPKKVNEKGETRFRTHRSGRIGIGGYIGANLQTRQFLEYQRDGFEVEEKQKSNFNTNGFVYGLSAYVGYRSTSLYLKYDLNPLFKNNSADQNNISLGLRFDLN